MTTTATASVLVLAAAVGLVVPAHAEEEPPCRSPCLTADGDGFGGGASGGTNDKAGKAGTGGTKGSPVSASSGSEPLTETYVEKVHVPTCSDNVPGGNDVLCTAAVTTCPDEAEIRFWIFERTVTRATGSGGPYSLVTDPTYVCLGPEEAALDPTLAIPSIVEREFKRVVVLKGVAEVSPRPDTLVNIPTLFATSAPASYDIPLMLLGQSVVITATAERYIWHVGDGASGTTSAPQGRLEHTYRRAASRQAYVVIEWSGTFSINGAPSQPITGTATTTGEPIAVEVKQARTELVRD